MKPRKQQHHILWQKWEDPLTQMRNQVSNHIRSQDSQTSKMPWEEKELENPNTFIPHMTMPLMSTPMGLVPAPVPDMSLFNFWIGHTNFNITGLIWQIINTSLGVETLDIFSPYRFRMSVGQAFDEDIVKKNLAIQIHQHLKTAHK